MPHTIASPSGEAKHPSWCDPRQCHADQPRGVHRSTPQTIPSTLTGCPDLTLSWWFPGDEPAEGGERFPFLALSASVESGGWQTFRATYEVTADQLRAFGLLAADFAHKTDAAREVK